MIVVTAITKKKSDAQTPPDSRQPGAPEHYGAVKWYTVTAAVARGVLGKRSDQPNEDARESEHTHNRPKFHGCQKACLGPSP